MRELPPCVMATKSGLTTRVTSKELTNGYFKKNGFENPIVSSDSNGLGLHIPTNVKEKPKKIKYAISPTIVDEVDWLNVVWPKGQQTAELKLLQRQQKFCQTIENKMFNQFTISCGGTSVWNHVLYGKMTYWLVPPTDTNLDLYTTWYLCNDKNSKFFLDTGVKSCDRIKVEAGQTIFIPSGWIYATFTLEDSLVVGGRFLHYYAVKTQIRYAEFEEAIKVPEKDRYPSFDKMMWYALQHYVDSGESDSPRAGFKKYVIKPLVRFLKAHDSLIIDSVRDPTELLTIAKKKFSTRREYPVPEVAMETREERKKDRDDAASSSRKLRTVRRQTAKAADVAAIVGRTIKRRRVRCKRCYLCLAPPCGKCRHCLVKSGIIKGVSNSICEWRRCTVFIDLNMPIKQNNPN